MRVLILTLNYFPELTGIGKFNGEMAESLSSKGHDVHIVAAPPYYPQWKVLKGYSSWKYRKEKLRGVNVWRCPVWVPKKLSGLNRIIHLTSFTLSCFPVLLFHIFWRPHIIIVIEPPLFCAPNALIVSWLCRARSWLHIQDFEMDAAFDLGFLSSIRFRQKILKVERWLMNKFDKVSTISPQMINRLRDKGLEEEKKVFFPNWVDTDIIFPDNSPNLYRKQLRISESCLVCLYSGNMGEKQGLEIVIEAARLLLDDSEIIIVMCGEGAAYSNLRELARGLSNIHWLPLQPIEKLNALLNMADVHLLPQRAAAADLVMPSKLTGMMASGKPILATVDADSQIAAVLDGAGVIVPPGDVNRFVEELNNLANHGELRETFGRNARKYAIEHFSKDAILYDFNWELQKLINS